MPLENCLDAVLCTGLVIALAASAVWWERQRHGYWGRLGALLGLGLWLGGNSTALLLLGLGLSPLLWAGQRVGQVHRPLQLHGKLARAVRAEAALCAVWWVWLLVAKPGDVMFIWCGTCLQGHEQRLTFLAACGLAGYLAAGVLIISVLLERSLLEWLALWRSGPLLRRIVGLALLQVLWVILFAASGPLIRTLAEGANGIGLGRAIGVLPGQGYRLSEDWALLARCASVMTGLTASFCLFQLLWEEFVPLPLRAAHDS